MIYPDQNEIINQSGDIIAQRYIWYPHRKCAQGEGLKLGIHQTQTNCTFAQNSCRLIDSGDWH